MPRGRSQPGLTAALALAVLTAACASDRPVVVVQGANGPVRVRVEIARSAPELAKGLMYRDSLADGDGMLFVFDDTAEHAFWMKNTFIPLDMLFIGPDRQVVGIVPEAVPQSTRSLSVGRPSRWVLEVPGGWAARHGVAAGSRVELPGSVG